MTGLANQVSYFNWALDLILDVECDMNIDEAEMDKVEADAEVLYGLLHARFILTTRGLQLMNEKFKNAQLGRCPRVMCHGQPTVPIGLSDVHNLECVHIYCPRCEEVYSSRSNKHAHVDGAFFGTTFPHLFFLTYPEHKPQKSTDVFVPRVFGFRINKSAYDVSLEYKNNVSKQEKTHK
jgi:casein kinase II subunit beta